MLYGIVALDWVPTLVAYLPDSRQAAGTAGSHD
jgi:hypothetical protein